MHLTDVATADPNRTAVIEAGTGEQMTYGFLDCATRHLAAHLAAGGLKPGDAVAILMDNTSVYVVAALAAARGGMYLVPVNWHLSPREAAHIVSDSGARALIITPATAELATSVIADQPALTMRMIIAGGAPGFSSYDLVGTDPPPLPEREPNGSYMFYSSGTTGHPKGIRPAITDLPFGSGFPVEPVLVALYGFDSDTRYLCPGPLYHAAPLSWTLGTIAAGGTAVIMERFDAEATLAAIERYRISHGQFVPTMFVRLLKLPEQIRARYDLTSLRVVVHAAAPCPVEVKRAMIDWLGPIVAEYYSSSEATCYFAIDSATWLAHPGSVGQAIVGIPHVLNESGTELPTGEIGQLWIESEVRFHYHNDEAKTSAAYNDRGWSTLGDMGHLDEQGYLYLADRRTDLILSGGVNVYPREVEEALAMHPSVADVAVIGLPDPEFGQQVRAVVQPAAGVAPGPELEAELLAHLQGQLARFKQPRAIDFVDEVPRMSSGKVLRRVVREMYTTR